MTTVDFSKVFEPYYKQSAFFPNNSFTIAYEITFLGSIIPEQMWAEFIMQSGSVFPYEGLVYGYQYVPNLEPVYEHTMIVDVGMYQSTRDIWQFTSKVSDDKDYFVKYNHKHQTYKRNRTVLISFQANQN